MYWKPCWRLSLGAVALLLSPTALWAGNVNATLQARHLRLTEAEPGGENYVRISKPGDGWLQFECIQGTINGEAEFLIPEAFVQDLTVDFGDGADTIEFDGGPSFRNITLNLGAATASEFDQDRVDVTGLRFSGLISIDTGPDIDKLFFDDLRAALFEEPELLKVLSIYTGAGEDEVSFVESTSGDYTIIQTYDSVDEPDVDKVAFESTVVDYLYVREGAGMDEFEFRDSFGTYLYLRGGEGGDIAGISGGVMGTLMTSMEGGNDTVALEDTAVRNLRTYGSTGFDSLYYTGLNLIQGGSFTKSGWERINGRFVGNQVPFPGPGGGGVFK